MEIRKAPNKHLTYDERNFIEIGLNNGRNFAKIAKDLNKSRTTIMREVRGHRFRKNPSGFNNRKIYVKTDENVKNLIVLIKKNVMKKKFVTN